MGGLGKKARSVYQRERDDMHLNAESMFWIGSMGLALVGIGISILKIAKGGLKRKSKASKALDRATRL